ncbi:MAG: glycosyltransferase family 2 protein [Fimbriimonadaceae bacterium]
MNKISVAIPSIGRETLSATLRSLSRQTMAPHEIIVVNQGPPEVEQREKWEMPVRWLHQDIKGLSRARNHAMSSFTGDWILFTDDDQEVNAEWVEQLSLLIDAYPDVSMFGGVYFPPIRHDFDASFVSQFYAHGEVLISRENYLLGNVVPNVQNDIWGGNFALSRACIDKIGFYEEAMGRGSNAFSAGEDTDYMMRVISAGMLGLLSCRLIIYHTYGARPYSASLEDEIIESAAVLHWKSRQPGSPLDPQLLERMVPFGKKKAALARLSGGKLFADQARRKAIFEKTTETLDREWKLEAGYLKRKEG